jgi:FdhE protein
VDAAALALPALQNDRAALERAAASLGVDATALGELVQLALQPVLWEAAAQAQSLADLDRWERGYCVVCGAWPGLAELVGTERRRVLRCVRCGSRWSWLVLLCPYCGTDDHRELGILELGPDGAGAERGRGHRIDVCERCHGYVKAVQTFSPSTAVRLVAEDVATLYLDAAAADAGYRRPGDVDAITAGIPRLARLAREGGARA